MSAFVYSKFFSKLKDEDVIKRYKAKLQLVGCSKDPFCLLGAKTPIGANDVLEWHQWPDVLYADIYNYLIETTSEYTHEQLKAYKSLYGYNYFVNGWINNLSVRKSNGKPNYYLFTATVKHSQSLSSPPLKV